MWDMIDDATSTVGTGFRFLRGEADKLLVKQDVEMAALMASLQRKTVQAAIMESVEEDLLKSFKSNGKRSNIIDFSEMGKPESENV